MPENPDDNPNHVLWNLLARAFHDLTEGMQKLDAAKQAADACGDDTQNRLFGAITLVREACDRLRPLVADDELPDHEGNP